MRTIHLGEVLGPLVVMMMALGAGSASAQPAAYPADAAYVATKCSAINSFDPYADAGTSIGERDLVGDTNSPALLVGDDGTYVYFRIRLEKTPLTPGTGKPLTAFGWGIGLDTNQNKANMEYVLLADGVTETVKLIRVTGGATLATWQPTIDTQPRYVEVKQAADGSSFGADADYFLTIAVPQAAAAQATAGDPSPIIWGSTFHLWAASSSNATDLNGDFMCWNDSAGAVSLSVAAAGPLTLGSSCFDAKKNGSETDIDCGGTCGPCGLGKGCLANKDCISAKCANNGKCAAPCASAPDGNDCDADGIVNILEDKNADGNVDPGETDFQKADTDADGLNDGVEDKNKNGKVDAGETDPTKADTDADGLADGTEDKNKNGNLDAGETNPLGADTDGDGLKDGTEDDNKNGLVDAGETDPLKTDTDADGLGDGLEDKNKNGSVDGGETDPSKADTDADGLGDGLEDKNKNGSVDGGETDPLKADTDGDGLSDGTEDKNKSGAVDAGETDPLKVDTDADDLGDGLEDKNKNGAVDAGETDPLKADTDGDGLSDGTEDKNKNGTVEGNETSPLKADTDGGGESDGHEVLVSGHNPLDPADDTTVTVPDAGPKPDLAPVVDLKKADLTKPGDLKPFTDGKKTDLPRTDGLPQKDLFVPTPQEPGPDRGTPDAARADLPSRTGVYLYGGGCGCSTGASPQDGLVGLMVIGGALLLCGRRRRPGRRGGVLLLVVALLIGGAAQAQTLRFPASSFQPAVSPLNFYVTESGVTLGKWEPSVGLLFNYAHDPLRLWRSSDESTVADVIAYQLNMDLLMAIGIGGWFEVGLGLPVTLTQDSDDAAVQMGVLQGPVGAGLGDLRLVPKVRFLRKSHVALALAVPVTFPTGSKDNLLGDDSVTVMPKAVATLETRYIDVGLNAGVRIRTNQSQQISDAQKIVVVNDDFLLSLGVRVPLWRERIDLIGDAFMSLAFEEQDQEEIPFELLGGLRFYLPRGFIANVGAGPGLTRGVGTPSFRVFAGAAYTYQRAPEAPPPPVTDRDGDGIADADDRCADDPEDKDGFQDDDGCPDDNDGDGIADGKDRCPDQAEDRDKFEDEDGCPDLDNDRDGIADAQDRCPVEAEDKDKFDDSDGCPDLDNDRDLIADDKDRCPNQPETFNGFEDQDGCPDQGKGPVQVSAGKITVPPVFFATAKDIILDRSKGTLDQVAETIKKNAWIKKVRIEGHTDDQGKEEYNQDLSQRRANSVMKFLVDRGVDQSRLEAQGFGASRPITSNKIAAGRAKNRRVEFIIVDPPTK